MNKKNHNIMCYGFIILIYVLIFQIIIQRYIPIFSYFDELLAIMTIPIVILNILVKKQTKIKKYDMLIISLLFSIFVIGIYANFKYRYQPISIVFSDFILIYKFFLVYYLGQIINNNKFINHFQDKIAWHLKLIIIIFFILTIANYIFEIFPSMGIRYGIRANELFYGHPTGLAAISIFLLTGLIMFTGKINTKYTYMLVIIILSTVRMKAIAFILAFIAISMYVCKCNKKITFSKIGIIAVICYFIALESINYYFFTSDKSARATLLNTSIEIANDYFPIGAGFATYASHFSATNYSPVYYLYGINNISGLREGKTNFISDSFWPMLLGQFGYIGTILYIICIVIIFRKIQLNFDVQRKYEYISKISILAYLLISSTSEAAFVHPMAIPLSLILGL